MFRTNECNERNSIRDRTSSLLMISETDENLMNKNLYSDHLSYIIQHYFSHAVEGNPDKNDLFKEKRINIFKKFVNNIADLFVGINNEDYNDKVKHEIEKCLRDLTALQSKPDQEKNRLRKIGSDSLFKCIKQFNDHWFKNDIEYLVNNQNSADDDKDLLENYLVKWIESNLNITSKKQEVTDSLLNKLKPILESGSYIKQIIKAQIINIFKELLKDFDLPKNKEIDLDKLATDLTNTSSNKGEENHICEKYNWVSRYGVDYEANFIDILNDTDRLKNQTVGELTDIIFGNMDLVLHDNNLAVINDITQFLKTTGEFTNSEASSLAEILVTNIKDTFNGGKGKSSNSFVVLTSEQELSNKGGKESTTHSNTEHGLEMLVNSITEWINDQPSDIFQAKDKSDQNKFVREMATNIQKKLANKKSENDIKNEIRRWLNKKVTPPMKRNVDGLAESLNGRIMQLQNDDLNKTQQKKKDKKHGPIIIMNTSKNQGDKEYDEFITKFIQLNYNVDDNIVKDVYKLILLEDLQKLSTSSKEELFRNKTHREFNVDKFRMEFDIVKEVYNWLKEMSFYYSLLQPGYETIEFIHGLTKDITFIETKRVDYPDKMDYDSWLHTEIAVYMLKKEKELTNEDKLKLDHYAEQLCFRIRKLRKDDKETNDLHKVITEHIKKNESALAKDYLKKILWHRRLTEDLTKMALENPNASINETEKRLSLIPIPRDESVTRFKLEIKYNIAINDWLRGFPLKPLRNKEEEQKRRDMIKELLHKIVETKRMKASDQDYDNNFESFVTDWIYRLKLDPKENVDVPKMISLLKSGLDFINWTEIQPSGTLEQTPVKGEPHAPNPTELGELMVQIIEDWCNNLPIGDDSEETKTKKEQLSTKIFQIVGTLSDQSRITNDRDSQELKDMLNIVIDVELRNLFGDVNEDINNQRLNLVDKIMEIKNMIHGETAGDEFVQILEKSIDESLGISLHNKYDPYFELLKKRIVMFWLLQNYDYAVDFHSLKYKKMLTDEIDFLFKECKNRKILPSDKHEPLNDIINDFYKSPPPDENSIIDEIELIKLRCEIVMWAKELPLRESTNFKTFLDRDQILTMLTKVLFDIERENESNPCEKMKTEILKWSKKLPLLPGEKNNLPRYADLLTCLLKSSANSRKCQRKAEPTNLKMVQETLLNLKCIDESNRTSNIPAPNKNANEEGEAFNEPIGNLIATVVNNWCQKLPLQFCSPNEQEIVQSIKNNIARRLWQCVSELTSSPSTSNNERLFNEHLNNELENILMQLTNDGVYWESEQQKNYRKYQFIDTLRNIRNLAQSDNDHEQYKNILKQIIYDFPKSIAPYEAVQFSPNTQQSILHYYLQYKNHNGDFGNQEIYKLKIADAINNDLEVDGKSHIDPLLATNRLICEMSKVEAPMQPKMKVTQSGKRRFSEPTPVKYSPPNLCCQSLPYPPTGPGPTISQGIPQAGPIYSESGSHKSINRSIPATKNCCPRPSGRSHSVSFPNPSRIAPPQQQNNTLPSMPLHFTPSRVSPGTTLIDLTGLRPFLVPPPRFSLSNDSSNVSPRAQQFNEPRREQPRHYQQQNPSDFTMDLPTEPGQQNVRQCPHESKRSNDGRNSGNRDGRSPEYCKTCGQNQDCAYHMPTPYPMNYNYY